MTAYDELEARFRRIGAFEGAIRMLEWDQAAMMPSGGAEARAEQLASLRRLVHEELSRPQLSDLLAAAESLKERLDAWERANLFEMGRRRRHAAAAPGDLVEALSRASSRAEALWREARAKGDFALVKDALGQVLRCVRELAALKASALGTTPYEALLDQYEPGAKATEIDRLFARIASFLPEILAQARRREGPPPLPAGPFPVAAQRHLITGLLARIGFDFAFGRLDESAHPFCGGVAEDVRITTRYDEGDFSFALMASLHELGHALYERGLPSRWRWQPVGVARGMALHESQSLLLEMQACRSREFFVFAAPLLGEAFGGAFAPEALYRHATRVAPGLIRVEADEVTYPFHIILRTRLERAMIAGELRAEELPGAWAENSKALLGIAPESDREGCLQDIHWYDGAWGYFPTYTLGALLAAQLFAAARRAIPNLMERIAAGDFAPLLGWLSKNVHAQGSLLSTAQVVQAATGEPLGTAAFERHLRERYLL
jgi:carboxypeptidase Taq